MSNPFYVDVQPMHSGVTGSSFHIKVVFPSRKTRTFLVDCGMIQEEEYHELAEEPLPRMLINAEALILTHNHIDHIGQVPLLVRDGFRGPIYCTEPTSKLVDKAWNDCLKIEVLESKRRAYALKKAVQKKRGVKKERNYPKFQAKHVNEALKRLNKCKYNQRIELFPNIHITFFMNGHVLGASMILIEIEPEGLDYPPINFLFSGDYKKENPFFEVENLPERVKNMPLHVICESTYGDNNHNESRKPAFEENVIQQVGSGRSILIPTFAFERGQVVLSKLRQMQETKKLDRNIPIYMDGNLLKKYTLHYCEVAKTHFCEEKRNIIPLNSQWVLSKEARVGLFDNTVQKIIVTTSGMGFFGPVGTYLPMFVGRYDYSIHFTGFQCEGTIGRKLQEATNKGEKAVMLYGKLQVVGAKIFHTAEFSSHATQEELVNYIAGFNSLKSISLNHGTKKAKLDLANKVIDSELAKEVGILERGHLYRYDSWRLKKVLDIEV